MFSVALFFRLAFFFHHEAQGWRLTHDPSLYLALADGLKHGAFTMFHPLDIPETTRMPGYPWLIHLAGGVRSVLLLQVVSSSLKIPLMHMLGTHAGLNGRMAWVPPLLMAIEPMDIILSGELLTESLFAMLLLGGLVLLSPPRGVVAVICAAACFAVAAYLRPNGLHIALLAGVLLLLQKGQRRWHGFLLMILCLLAVLPWMLRNRALDGRFHVSDSGVVVAAHFHVPQVLEAVGRSTNEKERQQLREIASRTNWTDRVEMRAYFEGISAHVHRTFLSHPFTWARLQLEKAARILVAPGKGYAQRHFGSGPTTILLIGVSLLFSLCIVAGAVFLIMQASRITQHEWLLLFVAAFTILSGAISTADARFKNPAMPLLLILAAGGIQRLLQRTSSPSVQRWLKKGVNPDSARA